MPILDVSDVLLDPNFMDTSLICIRNIQTVGNNGKASNTRDQISFAGVVTANSGLSLQRRPDGEIVTGSITIHTLYGLISGECGRDADEIAWKGKLYTVVTVNDYLTYGRGFIEAVCELKPLSG